MDSVISALRIVTLTSNSLFFCLRPSLTTNLSLCFLLLLTLHMPILCLLLSTSYPFLHFRFLHFVLLSSSISFFSTFIYILLCLFLVFSILPSFFNHLQVPFASFFLSIFCPFPYLFPIFPPFYVSFPPIFTQSMLLFYSFFLSTFTFQPSFFLSLKFLFYPFCFLSFILSTHCLISPISLPSPPTFFTLLPFNQQLQPTIKYTNQIRNT